MTEMSGWLQRLQQLVLYIIYSAPFKAVQAVQPVLVSKPQATPAIPSPSMILAPLKALTQIVPTAHSPVVQTSSVVAVPKAQASVSVPKHQKIEAPVQVMSHQRQASAGPQFMPQQRQAPAQVQAMPQPRQEPVQAAPLKAQSSIVDTVMTPINSTLSYIQKSFSSLPVPIYPTTHSLADSYKLSILFTAFAQENKMSVEEMNRELHALEWNRVRTVGDVRYISAKARNAMDLSPVTRELLRIIKEE